MHRRVTGPHNLLGQTRSAVALHEEELTIRLRHYNHECRLGQMLQAPAEFPRHLDHDDLLSAVKGAEPNGAHDRDLRAALAAPDWDCSYKGGIHKGDRVQ